MAKRHQIDPEVGKETQFKKGQSGNPNGRPVSIRTALRKLLEQDGAVTIPAAQVVGVDEQGNVTVKLPKQDQLAMKVVSWAMSSKNSANSLKALQMLIEQIDGKPDQRHQHDFDGAQIVGMVVK